MGTDSDRAGLLQAAFLAHEVEDGTEFFGFYRSKEGREFLRQLLTPYLRRQEMGFGKVATIISDSLGNPDSQDREVERTKHALKRWLRDGQSELWRKDVETSRRYLRRLEGEFLAVPELREIMADTAATVQKHQSGIALANFFYGPLPPLKADPEIESIHNEFEGFYYGQAKVWFQDNDPFEDIRREVVRQLEAEVRKNGLPPNVIELDRSLFSAENMFFDTREPGGYISDSASKHRYFLLSKVEDRNFMLAQEFDLEFDEKAGRPRRLSTGYAFPTADGTLHLLLTETCPPLRKSYWTFTPDETVRGHLTPDEGDRRWRIERRPFGEMWEEMAFGRQAMYWQKITRENNRLLGRDVDKLLEQLDRTKWNLVP